LPPLFAGWLFDVQHSYRLAFVIFAILCGLAVPAVLMVNPRRTRRNA
jgi:cyanate permease